MSSLFYIVTGEANFSMSRTSLTVGGFNQPRVARSLIELPEKGLSQRFLWLFPKPVYRTFDNLEPIDKEFTGKLGMCTSTICVCMVDLLINEDTCVYLEWMILVSHGI